MVQERRTPSPWTRSFEVSTDKVDSEVPSPVAGVVTEILAAEGDVVEVGQVLCRVGDADAAPAAVPEPLLPLDLCPGSRTGPGA